MTLLQLPSDVGNSQKKHNTTIPDLRGRGFVVKRPDAQELLDIRNGSMTYEELLAYSENLEKEIFGKWIRETELRKKPDIKTAAVLLMDIQDAIWSNQ